MEEIGPNSGIVASVSKRSDGYVVKVVELFYSRHMATAFKLGVKPCLHRLGGHLGADEPLTDADHIRIVVLTSRTCRCGIPHRRRAHSRDLVSRHTDPDSASTNTHTALGATAYHRPADGRTEVWIVDPPQSSRYHNQLHRDP